MIAVSKTIAFTASPAATETMREICAVPRTAANSIRSWAVRTIAKRTSSHADPLRVHDGPFLFTICTQRTGG